MPDDIKRIGVQFMKDPEHVRIKSNEMTATLIDQYFVKCKDYERIRHYDTFIRRSNA